IAADLLSQAEHDPTSQSILMTDDSAFGDAVAAAVEAQLGNETSTARESWTANGAIIVLESLDDAPPLIDRLAPEHLELAVANPDSMFSRVRHAGSVFLGRHTPEALGDYLAGPNHVLPTGRRARFSSGLSVTDFMKRTSFLSCPPEALPALGPAAIALATAEGLPAHARSVEIRMKGLGL
ncbi:MAG TPA: histidinol dehydrogenase, partial [Sphingomonas sp.]|nr:histidinol dehydrogenase [Sphingomonas sp.]